MKKIFKTIAKFFSDTFGGIFGKKKTKLVVTNVSKTKSSKKIKTETSTRILDKLDKASDALDKTNQNLNTTLKKLGASKPSKTGLKKNIIDLGLKVEKKPTKSDLRKKLNIAVEEENYEMAAKLRDEINSIQP